MRTERETQLGGRVRECFSDHSHVVWRGPHSSLRCYSSLGQGDNSTQCGAAGERRKGEDKVGVFWTNYLNINHKEEMSHIHVRLTIYVVEKPAYNYLSPGLNSIKCVNSVFLLV